MNLGIYRSWHAIVALAVAGGLFAWHVLEPLPFGSRDDGNVDYLLTTGWIAVACYVVLALYAVRRAAHRLALSPEFAWKAQLPALERAQSELVGLQQRALRREVAGAAAMQREAKGILARNGVQRVLRVCVARDPQALGLWRLVVTPRQPLGTLAGWLHAHLYYGFAAAAIVWFHGGGRCGTSMGLLLNVLSYAVLGTGFVGAILWTFGPTWLTRAERELSVEKAFALREHYARKLAEAIAFPQTKAKDAADAAAAAKVAAEAAAKAAENPALAGKELEAAKKAAKKTADDLKKAETKAEQAAASIAAETERLQPEIATLRGQADAVTREAARLGFWRALLRGWRIVHVPCSVALLALVAVHVLSIWYY
ncbi:MAG: hypothetical protein JNK15_06570 [Planctomycetes bacterium]|nr:hypothetical protein [Planctomycetota bacterium]